MVGGPKFKKTSNLGSNFQEGSTHSKVLSNTHAAAINFDAPNCSLGTQTIKHVPRKTPFHKQFWVLRFILRLVISHQFQNLVYASIKMLTNSYVYVIVEKLNIRSAKYISSSSSVNFGNKKFSRVRSN